jgi:hypothetical protein
MMISSGKPGSSAAPRISHETTGDLGRGEKLVPNRPSYGMTAGYPHWGFSSFSLLTSGEFWTKTLK